MNSFSFFDKQNIFYPAFGSMLKDRTFEDFKNFRFGFAGQEKDNEVSGEGNSYSAEFWQYDSRLGRRWNLDPKPTIGISSYSTFANNPILFTDLQGDTLSFNLFSKSANPIFTFVANHFIKRQTADKVYAVFAHSSKYAVFQGNAKKSDVTKSENFNLNTPDRIIDFLSSKSADFKKDIEQHNEITLILYSCHAGEGEGSIASQISKAFPNITVIAAKGSVVYGPEGKKLGEKSTIAGVRDSEGPGGWNTFDDGKIIDFKPDIPYLDKQKGTTTCTSCGGNSGSSSTNNNSENSEQPSGGPSFH